MPRLEKNQSSKRATQLSEQIMRCHESSRKTIFNGQQLKTVRKIPNCLLKRESFAYVPVPRLEQSFMHGLLCGLLIQQLPGPQAHGWDNLSSVKLETVGHQLGAMIKPPTNAF
jgi:hypothetical protein